MRVIGIDLGMTGAIAAISPGCITVHDLPICEFGGHKMVDGKALCFLVRELAPQGGTAYYENVRVMPKMTGRPTSSTGEGALLHTRGVVEAVLRITGITPNAIEPRTWQRVYGLHGKANTLGLDTREAKLAAADAPRQLALKLFPSVAGDLARKKDANRADALLIANFGFRGWR